jgi:hypothetical protein
MRAVHSRLRVVCELAWPLERALELSDQVPIFPAPLLENCECTCSQPPVSGTYTCSGVLPMCRVFMGYYYISTRPPITLTGSREWLETETAYFPSCDCNLPCLCVDNHGKIVISYDRNASDLQTAIRLVKSAEYLVRPWIRRRCGSFCCPSTGQHGRHRPGSSTGDGAEPLGLLPVVRVCSVRSCAGPACHYLDNIVIDS